MTRFAPLVLSSALALVLGACATAVPVAEPAAAPAATPFQFDGEAMRRHVEMLSSDAFEGRGPATPGEAKTIAYISEQLRAAGLEPGGDIKDGKRLWTQAVPLLRASPAGTPTISATIGGAKLALAQGEEIAIRNPLTGEDKIRIEEAPLLFAGYGVTAPERGWDDFKDVDVRGKLIVVFVNDPDFGGGEGDFGGKTMTYYGRWTYKYEEAARRGALGTLIIHETEPASYGWATVKNSNTIPNFDIVRANPKAEHAPVEAWIQRDLAEKLFAASGTSLEAARAAAKRKDFRPMPLKASLSIALDSTVETITSYNVAGLVRGKARPDETVIYSAHWDHLGVGAPDARGDRIYNGAIDNATGVAHLIEQARSFAAGPRPDRSVLFLAVTAEEKGLLGSEYYAANPLFPAAKTAGALNTDVMGVMGPARDYSVRGNQQFGLLDLLIDEASKRGRRITPDPRPEAGSFFRSDHFTFAKAGIPALSFSPGQDLVTGGVERAKAWQQAYTADKYHQPADEYSPDWDFSGMVADAELLHAVGWRLANSSWWPEWATGSEFRAKREESAAERR